MKKLLLILMLISTPLYAAKVCIEFDDSKKDRIINGVAGQYGYQARIQTSENPDGTPITIPNPETKAKFVKRVLAQSIKNAVRSFEATQAAEVARLAAIKSVTDEITIN